VREGEEADDVHAWRRLRFMLVAVLGDSGLGKTTLAKQVYCNIQARFDCHA
jgi:uridine kinase